MRGQSDGDAPRKPLPPTTRSLGIVVDTAEAMVVVVDGGAAGGGFPLMRSRMGVGSGGR